MLLIHYYLDRQLNLGTGLILFCSKFNVLKSFTFLVFDHQIIAETLDAAHQESDRFFNKIY